MKKIFLLFLFLLPFFPALGDQDLYTAQVLENGKVEVYKNDKVICNIVPQILLEGFQPVLINSWAKDPRFNGMATLPTGEQVGVVSEVVLSGPDIHVHYRLTPFRDIRVLQADALVYWPYGDWIGASYRLGQAQGAIPYQKKEKTLLASSDSCSFSLGPSETDDLIVQVKGEGSTVKLGDSGQAVPFLALLFNHGEPKEKSWLWKAGDTKDFDFTVTLNHDLLHMATSAGTVEKGFEGHWYGTVENKGYEYRAALFITKGSGGKWTVYYDDLENGKFHQPNKNASVRGRVLRWGTGADRTQITLGQQGNSITGAGNYKKFAYTLHMERGSNYTLPRLDAEGQAVTTYSYQMPQTLSDGWPVGDLKESPLDPGIVEKGICEILRQKYLNMQSVVVAYKGRLLLDEYFEGFGPGDIHQMQSVSKSVFSILFGIAHDQGLLGPDQKLYDFYPEYRTKPGWSDQKDKIRLRDLLSMSSGFDCDDWVEPKDRCNKDMLQSEDWISEVLTQPMAHEPGEHFAYCSSCMTPMGDLLKRQSGLSVSDFAQKYLNDPLGIPYYHWYEGPHEVTAIAGADKLRPRDMAKLGQLYLQKGKWNGRQVVSEKWVEESTRPQVPHPKEGHRYFEYGYLWWMEQMPCQGRMVRVLYAAGLGGQFIFVVPELELVCALTEGDYQYHQVGYPSYDFFKTFILGAIK